MKISAATVLLLASSAYAQSTQSPQFEVASVKLAAPDAPAREGRRIAITKDTLSTYGLQLRACLMWAYQMQASQIVGPGWLTDVNLDIVAKAPTPVDDQQLYLMLRGLLAARLGLRAHIERKDMPVYRLTLAKGSPKFSPSTTDGPLTASQGPGGITFQHVSMFELATEFGSKMLDHPLIDATGLKGRYDFRLDLSDVTAAGDDRIGAVAAMITAMHDQLGLNVEKSKDAVDVLIIDAVNRTPTEN